LNIGAVLDPQGWHRWEEAKALLEPARELGGQDSVTAQIRRFGSSSTATRCWRLARQGSRKNGCEVILVGGREHRRWLGELSEELGAAAKEAGAKRMVAIGRRGWLKSLLRLGWAKHSEAGGMTVYTRGSYRVSKGGSKSTKTTVEPPAWARPLIEGAGNDIMNTVHGNAGNLQGLSNNLTGMLPGLQSMVMDQSTLQPGFNYNQDVLSGKYLGQGNPYLKGMIDQTGQDVGNKVNATVLSRWTLGRRC
jgi:hypothetical protein